MSGALAARLAELDWAAIERELDAQGCARLPGVLSQELCRELTALYPQDAHFRSRIVMAKHGFGRGEYRYFAYPLPPPVANRWNALLGLAARYPAEHEAYLAECHRAGQRRPTPLLLRYETGDYNCLHQDLYGERVFPLQVAFLLSAPERDFTGGEFVLTEQRRGCRAGGGATAAGRRGGVRRASPVAGMKGYYRVNLRHGVSRIRTGQRHTLGVIFHDAL